MKNSFWLGMAIGVCAPAVAYLVMVYTDLSYHVSTKPALIYAVAAAVNLILVRFFYRAAQDQRRTANGIVFVTFLAMVLFLYFHKLSM
ncbi:hypothetical protein [Sphingobacterium suaedae]|uniref:Stationary phase survival protein SurE n=1 Tax=Sphingobacterium suaedae TaxID=1686402 RepID=A0ABW5KFL2_9SPHI